MKSTLALAVFLVMNANGCCKESDFDAYKHEETSNLTTEDEMFINFMRPQRFTPGTLLGLLVASIVVIIGSFLVLWRVCCDVEIRLEGMEPLRSISQTVSDERSPPRPNDNRSVSTQSLLGHSCRSSVLEIA
ncbi:uncharacterized protein [Parasteatoda tepidariorum]|nr:uncharacterized protein LOC107454718 isoform X2 [Parasteatoda tepidariorum]